MVKLHDAYLNLSPVQMKKLSNGDKIRLSAGSLHGQHHVKVTKVQLNKINKRKLLKKGMELQLSKDQLMGSGFFSDIGNWAYNNVVKPVGQQIISDPVGTLKAGFDVLKMVKGGKAKPKSKTKPKPKSKSPTKTQLKKQLADLQMKGGSFLPSGYGVSSGGEAGDGFFSDLGSALGNVGKAVAQQVIKDPIGSLNTAKNIKKSVLGSGKKKKPIVRDAQYMAKLRAMRKNKGGSFKNPGY